MRIRCQCWFGVNNDGSQQAILTNFDTRLVKLEKSILPLHSSTQLLNRRVASECQCNIRLSTRTYLRADIDSTLSLIDEMSGARDDLVAEEGVILRGCVLSKV